MKNNLEVRNQRLDVRCWGLEFGVWRLEVKGWKVVRQALLTSIFLLLTSSVFAQTLEDYQQIAAKQNPGLQAKYKEYEAALQKVRQVNTLPDPTFSFGYFISPVETRVGPQRARFNLTMMFPWFGTLKAQGDAAALLAESKFQAFIDARNRLFFQVAEVYYPLYELEEQLRLQRENLEILESFKTLASRKYENNQSTMVDVLRVDIMVKDARTDILILEDKKQPLLTRFNNQLNRDVAETVAIPDTIVLTPVQADYRKDSLQVGHPLLEELSLKVKAMEKQEKAAIRKGLPGFGLGLDYVIVAERAGMDIPDNGQDVIMPMLTVSLPIFRGKYKAAKQEASLMQEAFRNTREEISNNLENAYESTWFEIEQNRQYLDLYSEQVLTSQQALNLLYSAYANNNSDFEEVLRMQQQLLKYQMVRATAIRDFYIALARLDYLTAKSFDD